MKVLQRYFAVNIAQAVVFVLFAFLGLIDAPAPVPIAPEDMEALSMVAVYDKHDAADTFSRNWSSFDPVQQGEEIGRRADGTPVLAEFDGRILFPDAAAGANSEWYYLTRLNPSF